MSYFHRLIGGHGPKCVFLSRPRRFGKSRMISTFEEIFKGRRDLAKMVVGHAVEQLA